MKFDHLIENFKDDMIKATQEIIRIKSVEEDPVNDKPFGLGVQQCLEYAMDLGHQLGFETKNVDNYAGHIQMGQGDEIIGVLAHLDVVPEGDNWDYPPYGGEIHDGRIYGRGTNDDKGPAMAALYAMKAIQESGVTLNKRVRLILGTNEETGSKGVEYYLKKEETPILGFTPDADFPVIHGEMGIMVFNLEKTFNEELDDGGIKVISINGGNRPNMVPDYAEAKIIETYPIEDIVHAFNAERDADIRMSKVGDFTSLKSYGVSAHGGSPGSGKNAISKLIELLDLVDLAIGDLSSFIRFYARNIGNNLHGEKIGCAFEDEASGKLVYNVGIIDLSNSKVSVTVNIRYPITSDHNAIVAGHKEVNKEIGLAFNEIAHVDPIYVPKDHTLVKTLMKVYNDHTGRNDEPITIAGGTYARELDNCVAFGALFPGQEDVAHQRNEYISIDDLILNAKIYASAIYELAK